MGFWNTIKKAWLDAWDDAGRELGIEPPPERRADFVPRVADNRTLLEKLNDSSPYEWTEEELNDWVESLPDDRRRFMLSAARDIMNRGGDPLDLLCKLRRQTEQIERENAARARAKRPTLGGLLWAWDEAMLMSDEREFFARENKKARQRGE